MFIRELQIDGYGPLQNVRCDLDAPVTVVFGPNEAGKSTLLRFIRSMLYGIPTRKDLVERAEPVFGGRHGGRMIVAAGGGQELLLERYADGGAGRKTPGGLIVRDQDGMELRWTQSEWERLALGGVSERLFRQLFAVSLDELHELRSLQGEEIGNFLYHAGLAGGAALSEARRKLAGEMDKLYRPRGTTQEMNRILAAIKEAEAAMRQSRDGIALFQETTEALSLTEHRLAELQNLIPPLHARTAEIQSALNLREWWLKLQLLLEEEEEWIQRLPNRSLPPLPEEAASAWSDLQRKRQAAIERFAVAERAVAAHRERLTQLRWDEQLLQHAEELEKLEAMREAMAARQEESKAVAADLGLLEETVESLLSRLSPAWSEEDLLAFGSVTAEREPLRRLQHRWAEAERSRERLEADLARLQRQRETLLAETDRVDSLQREANETRTEERSEPFCKFRASTRESLLRDWYGLEDELRLLERARIEAILFHRINPAALPSATVSRASRAGRPSGGGSSYRLFAAGLLAAMMAIAVPFIGSSLHADSSLITAVTAVLAMLAIISVWNGRQRTNQTSSLPSSPVNEENLLDRRLRVEERFYHLFVQPDKVISAMLGDAAQIERPIHEETWRHVRQQFQETLNQIDLREREHTQAKELRGRLAELEREKEALDKAINQADAHLDGLQQEWQGWLRMHKLPASLTPDTLPELLSMAEQGYSAVRRRTRVRDRKEALAQMQCAFLETASAVFEICPPPASMQTDAALSVTWLYRKAAEHRAIKDEAQRAESSIQEAERTAAEAAEELQKIEADITSALQQANADDEASYERRLHIDERRRHLLRERREIELRLEAGRQGQSAAALYELLERRDEAALSLLLQENQDACTTAESEKTELLDRRGRLAQELERLQREAETEDRLLRKAELESKLDRLTERYAVLALSDRLLKETKAVFEEERQPEVLRLASRYFSTMTGGAYVRITAPAEGSSVFAETDDRRVTDSVFLSRGTQEQLYLAMRFALADAASRENPLPLVLDDLFVHFDEQRLRQIVPVIGEISLTRQVILFTCHRHVADSMKQGLPSARIIAWEAQGAAAPFAARDPG